MTDRLKIGISACFFHPDANRPVFAGKTLQYIEQSVAHWVAASGEALPVMVPSPEGDTSRGIVGYADYARWLDGLVLMGGSDMWPGHYGEEPMKPQWTGDAVRDRYETALARAFVAEGKPVFGVCRGLQVLNVALGGTLHQHITDGETTVAHHRALHPASLTAGSLVAEAMRTLKPVGWSQHHQAIDRLGRGLVVTGRAADGTIEAVELPERRWVVAVQWHPEDTAAEDPAQQRLFDAFVAACADRLAPAPRQAAGHVEARA